MVVKNNYDECLTNLACSIKKYFELDYRHKTLSYIDYILEEIKPKNVVVILFDGMGSRILDRILEKDSFFIKNRYKEITTVFPATTTAATTSIITGLNPVEHGFLGWNTYIKPIDKVITLFRNCEKGKEEVCDEFLKIKDKLYNKSIVEEINEKGKYSAIEFAPFSKNKYENLDELLSMIEKECKKESKKYIYAYDNEPDHTMHLYGPDSIEAKELIIERNKKVEELCNKLEDTVVIVIADHGHIKVENIYLNNYPEILDMLDRTTSLEQRAISFKVKAGLNELFEDKFNKLFGKYFKLYNKEDIIKSNLFGDGEKHEFFIDAIGDFIAIAEESNKCLVNTGEDILCSQHAGYTDDEVYVPLILIKKK